MGALLDEPATAALSSGFALRELPQRGVHEDVMNRVRLCPRGSLRSTSNSSRPAPRG